MESLLFCVLFTSPDDGLCELAWYLLLKDKLWAILRRSSRMSRAKPHWLTHHGTGYKRNEMCESRVCVSVCMSVYKHLNFWMHWPVSSRHDPQVAIWDMLWFPEHGENRLLSRQEGDPIHALFGKKPKWQAKDISQKSWKESFTAPSSKSFNSQAQSTSVFFKYHYRVPCYLDWATDFHLNGGLLRSAEGPLGRCRGGKM